VIVDAHMQFGPGLLTDAPFKPAVKAVTAADAIDVLDAAGIDRALVSAPRWLGGSPGHDFVDPNYEAANAAIAAGVARHPERLTGIARVNPKFGVAARRELEQCLEGYGFRGLLLDNEAEGFSYQDLRLLGPLVEVCAARRLPVMVYTWVTPSQPVQLIVLARAFPEVPFVMLHSGWRLTADTMIAAQRAPNLYFETSHAGSNLARSVGRTFGIERVVFGSASPFALPEVELNRVRRWGDLTEAQLALVLGGTISRLIGMEATA
jgi:predicted TIM-barrel fold metal-dependent hydrolase